MAILEGTPSDQAPDILATGRADFTAIFVSMSARDPAGDDADYIRWHTLDHRPDIYLLPSLVASARLVSTPECRRARAISTPRYDAVDHFMTYMFSAASALDEFSALTVRLRKVPAHNRAPLPPVGRGVFWHQGGVASPRIKIGADVLPWWPALGAYILIEQGAETPAADIVDVPGVAGAWWATGTTGAEDSTGEDTQLQMTYTYLDDDPAETAARLRSYLERRWDGTSTVPLLAAPFHSVVNYDWGRYLP
jgi:hypothetical protein